MMPKMTVVLNDYGTSMKLYINYSEREIAKIAGLWDQFDQRLVDLHSIDAFEGYTKWSELSINHYRFLISRGLAVLANLDAEGRIDNKNPDVEMTNFLILAFIIRLEHDTKSEIEHFRINRYNDQLVTFDYSATFDLVYARPQGKTSQESSPTFSVVNFNPESDIIPLSTPDFSIVSDDDTEPS